MKVTFNLLINLILLNLLVCTNNKAQQWNSLPNSPTGLVNAFVADTINNCLIVGGSFSNFGPLTSWYVGKWNGNNWSSFGTGNNFTGGLGVSCLEIYNNQ